MPSVSKKQHNLMAAVAHNPKFAKKVGIPQSVGKEFNKADKGKQFKRGGEMAESKKMVKKEVAFMKSKGAPKSMIKHEKAEVKDTGMKKGGAKPGVYAGLTGKPAPAAKPAGNVVQRMQSAMQKKESAMAARKPAAPAAKPATDKAAAFKAAAARKDAAAAKPAAPAGETMAPMDPGRTPMGAGAKAFAPAIKKAKGGKVCGMKAGGVKKELPTAKDLGSMNMKKGGRVKCMAGGGYVRAADGVTKKGKTKGRII
jgi:hypothetical protein